MGLPRTCLLAFSITVVWLLSFCPTAQAIDSSNVLVLYNSASPDGLAIANYYAQTHPGVQLLALTGVGTSENITADDYLNTIRPQVLSALTPTTDVIVTTKGLPLRIQVTEPAPTAVWPNPPQYTDPNGVLRSISSWKPYSSFESELADIDKVSSWQMMGDQSYTQSGHFTSNPYYNSTASFSHSAMGTRLTARLDGYTVGQVEGAISRAQNAFIGPNNTPAGPFHFLIDNDPSKGYATPMVNLSNNLLTAGLPMTYDNTSAFVGATTGPVIGYDGHGTNQASTPAHYVTGSLNVTLANGAVFNSWESYNAYSFNQGGYGGGQGQVADWLQIGGTAGVGNVEEPTASASTVTNEDKMFKMLLNGKTFAEAAWSADRQLSWVNTVVGDPLMTWRVLLAGDVNMDGLVNQADLEAIGAHWGNSVASGGYGWTSGDLNGDGVVDMLDLALMSSTWGQTSSWLTAGSATALPGGSTQLVSISSELSDSFIPEPSGLVLMALAGGAVLSFARLRRSRATRQS
jgi:uncharacterized protein (TIGR03790 family)